MLRRFTIILLFLSLSLIGYWLSAEEVRQEDNVINPVNALPDNCNTIRDVYRSLPAIPNKGMVDRNTYYVWAITNYVFGKMKQGGSQGRDMRVSSIDEFVVKFAKGARELAKDLANDNPRLPEVTEIAIRAVAKTYYQHCPFPEKKLKKKYAEAWQELADFFTPYRCGKKPEALKFPEIRQALSLGIRNDGGGSLYDSSSQMPGSPATFVLSKMDCLPRTLKAEVAKYKSIEDIPDDLINKKNWNILGCPIPPLARISDIKQDTKVTLSGNYHPTLTFHNNACPGIVVGGPWNYCPKLNQESGAQLSGFFQTAVFQSCFYSKECVKLAPWKKIKDGETVFNHLSGIAHSRVYADIRVLRIDREVTISRDIEKLVDPASPAYSRIIALAVVADHLELGDPVRIVKYLKKYRPTELAKYQKYIDDSEAFLVASYKRTVQTEVIANQGNTFYRKSTFITPDYTEEPEISVLYIPIEWLRYASYVGVHNTLFDFNLMGIGDREIKLPEFVGW